MMPPGRRTHHRRCQRIELSSTEAGSSLIMVLAIMIIGGLTIVSLLAYARTSLDSAGSFRSRTTRVQAATGAIDAAITAMRADRTKGSPTSFDTQYAGAIATCTGELGSGAPISGSGTPISTIGYADRTVNCTAVVEGRNLVRVRVRILDQNGNGVGSEVQVLSRTIGG